MKRQTSPCPRCGGHGTNVTRRTVKWLLTKDARSRVEGDRPFQFCATHSCSVVYYDDADTVIGVGDVATPVYQKSHDPSRLVCYCFSHRVVDIETEVKTTGQSSVLKAIVDKCRRGLDRCDQLNPQGFCCVGNIKRLVEAS